MFYCSYLSKYLNRFLIVRLPLLPCDKYGILIAFNSRRQQYRITQYFLPLGSKTFKTDEQTNEHNEHAKTHTWNHFTTAENRERGCPAWNESTEYQKRKKAMRAALTRQPRKLTGELARKELTYFPDPLKLANYVLNLLKRGEDAKAISLVQRASSKTQCTVSWNHVIDWQLSKGKVNAAIKSYNDMKKRAQRPNSYTITLLLRGLANNVHSLTHAQVVAKALSIYHRLSEPNVIHTNAVLNVCNRAGDMDALWGVAAKMPDSGFGAPDATSYTTILTAIKYSVTLALPHELSPEQLSCRRGEGVDQARRIWQDVVQKWRVGDLMLDEKLVCSMGRMLLLGSRPRDWDDVLSLTEQSMNIPRMAPHFGTVERQKDPEIPAFRGSRIPRRLLKEDERYDLTDEHRRGAEFEPVPEPSGDDSGKSQGGSSIVFVQPSNNTLSLVLEACLKTVAEKAARNYWFLLTDPKTFNIRPDEDNLHIYLRVLRQSRAATQVAPFIREEFPRAGVQPSSKTFRIAMSTCMRNITEPGVEDAAGSVLDLMSNTLEDPDPRSLLLYINIVFKTTYGSKMLQALDRFNPVLINLCSMLNFGSSGPLNRPAKHGQDDTLLRNLEGEDRETAIEVCQRVIACYHYLLSSSDMPPLMISDIKRRMSRISAFVSRKNMEQTAIDPKNGNNIDSNKLEHAQMVARQWKQKREHLQALNKGRSRVNEPVGGKEEDEEIRAVKETAGQDIEFSTSEESFPALGESPMDFRRVSRSSDKDQPSSSPYGANARSSPENPIQAGTVIKRTRRLLGDYGGQNMLKERERWAMMRMARPYAEVDT